MTWHRPYLALFEVCTSVRTSGSQLTVPQSALYKHVNDIANGISSTFAGRDTYLKAAKGFRMPYWDWARSDRQFPDDALISDLPSKTPSFTVRNFDGAKYNPLLYYKFPDGTPDEITWVSAPLWKHTSYCQCGIADELREIPRRCDAQQKEMSPSL